MTWQLSVEARNAANDSFEDVVGTGAILKFRSGAAPANVAAADSGTVIATLTLPTDWMSASSGGVKAKLGTWEDTSADATGTIGHFRIYESDGTTCHAQGTVTETSGGGDIEVDNADVNAGQQITVTAFSITAGNA